MIRTRIAPSPTGTDIHIGNLYTAYLNWTLAKKHGGKFIVRIEDTDRTRRIEGSEEKILSTLNAFGLTPDESVEVGGEFGPYRQSERLDIYKKYSEILLDNGSAYLCTCSRTRLETVREDMKVNKQIPKYDKYCLSRQEAIKKEIENGKEHVVRLNVPEDEDVIFQDIIRGEVKINTGNLDDQVLMKSDGYPTYHLAVVIDDYLMKISHVIRAEEWISSTPKHILIYKAFGWELPKFAHVPILRNPDKSKLSKRKNPVWASWYLEQGFLPSAVLNYLALMGWSYPEGKEIFDADEFAEVFTLERIQPVGPVFDVKKLEWMNGQYIMKLEISNLKFLISNFYKDKNLDPNILEKSIPLVRERLKKLNEYLDIAGFLFEKPSSYEKDFSGEKELLKKVADKLESLESWKADEIGNLMQDFATSENIPFGKFFMMLRVVLSGKKITPPLNDSMEILGKEECIARIKNVI